jgi:carboxylesterase
MEGLAAALADAGMAAHAVRLPGHGEGYADFRTYRFPDWLGHAEKELRDVMERCGRVVIIGFSMGGTIALHLASRYPAAGAVILSAPVFVPGPYPWPLESLKYYAHAMASRIRRLPGSRKQRIGETSRDIAPWKGYDGPSHFGQLASMHRGCAVTRALLPGLTAPILIMQDARDGLVNPNNAWAIARRVSSTDTTVILTRIRENVTRRHMITTHRETAALVTKTAVAFCVEKTLDPQRGR